MKKLLILIIALFIASILVCWVSSYNKADNRTKNYTLYLANTNFYVVFADGDWSKKLKEFVVTDLNCLYNTVELKRINTSIMV